MQHTSINICWPRKPIGFTWTKRNQRWVRESAEVYICQMRIFFIQCCADFDLRFKKIPLLSIFWWIWFFVSFSFPFSPSLSLFRSIHVRFRFDLNLQQLEHILYFYGWRIQTIQIAVNVRSQRRKQMVSSLPFCHILINLYDLFCIYALFHWNLCQHNL